MDGGVRRRRAGAPVRDAGLRRVGGSAPPERAPDRGRVRRPLARGRVTLLPSLKANLSLALRRILNSEGLGCDTFGPGELHAALASGIDPALVSVNGSAKDAALVRRAVEAGARVTLDSRGELDLVSEAARAVRPDGDRCGCACGPTTTGSTMPSDFDASVSIRARRRIRYKPGIPLEQAADVARRALADDGVELAGVMAHLGRHSADPEVWRGWRGASRRRSAGSVRRARRLAAGRDRRRRRLRRAARPDRPRRPRRRRSRRSRQRLTGGLRAGLAGGRDRPTPGSGSRPSRAARSTPTRHPPGHGPQPQAPGGPGRVRWVETDTTEMFMADLLIEHARFGVVDASRADAPRPRPAPTSSGMSCGFDVLVPRRPAPELAAGDVLAFLDTGAYQDACASNFNGLPRPGTVLVSARERRGRQAGRVGEPTSSPATSSRSGCDDGHGPAPRQPDRRRPRPLAAFYRDLLGVHMRREQSTSPPATSSRRSPATSPITCGSPTSTWATAACSS